MEVKVDTIEKQYEELRPTSRQLYERATKVLPSGLTHDGRSLAPFPIYATRAAGSRKWDVDGREYIDYMTGHGALLLGHQHPEVMAAVIEQASRGTHYGACHELEIEWAELVTKLVPSAEKVRFTGSGTEATMMAVRLARAFTGKDKIIKFQGHFHGWHDAVIIGYSAPYDQPVPGIPEGTAANTIVLPVGDPNLVEDTILSDGNVAAVIVEPSGGGMGTHPINPQFLAQLREITTRRDTLLIFDEVVTGFRWSPGGAQARYKITPDLSPMAKILAGGLPGGGLAGRADIMDLLAFKTDPKSSKVKKMYHPGTFNANPLTAAAGVAALKLVGNPAVQERADQQAHKICVGMNKLIDSHGVPGCVYTTSSIYHIMLGVSCPEHSRCSYDGTDCTLDEKAKNGAMPRKMVDALRCAMLINGVDLMGGAKGILSAVHSDEDVALTLDAFDKSLTLLTADGLLSRK